MAKKKAQPKKLNQSSKQNSRKYNKRFLNPEQYFTNSDKEIDKILQAHLGDKYRRVTVFDLYPMELERNVTRKLNSKEQVEMLDYYQYARKDVEKANKSKLLQFVKSDFDLDGVEDYAAIVKHKKYGTNYLVVFNESKMLLQKDFFDSYIEQVNSGKYPFNFALADGDSYTIHSPAIRVINYDETKESGLMFNDRNSQDWLFISSGFEF